MAPKFIGVVIDVRKAFERYARELRPDEWDRLMAARQWFRGGRWLRRWWRHEVYRRLWPCRYEERQLQCEDAERQMKRAILMAEMDQVERMVGCWQN